MIYLSHFDWENKKAPAGEPAGAKDSKSD